MNYLYDLIGIPFGYLMSFIYSIVPNYALAIIIFTLVTKLLLFPVNYKTQKNAARMQLFQPKLEKLKKAYGSNPQRLQEEQQKLYQQEGINPMGSCLPMFVQMFLLFGVIDVVYKPITHILHITKSVRVAAVEKASELAVQFGDVNKGKEFTTGNLRSELLTAEALEKHPSEFRDFAENFFQKVSEFSDTFSVFGANLGKTPEFRPEVWNKESIILFCIPFLAGLAQLIFSVYSQIHQKKVNPQAQAAGGGCMTAMTLLMPVWSIWIAFEVPAGVGFYWIFSSLFSFFITFALNCYFTKDRIVAINEKEKQKAKEYAEKHPGKKSFMQRMMEQQQASLEQQGGIPRVDENGEKISRSEQNKKDRDRINEARKRMAEKYGDEYDDKNDEE
ncbi:MAG: YidC/Oxa1 family membrane protein insertase [Ruminococcus sp.]|nr:YidC/Oxa1 family membrane protein insertase [Ruminococcus sp.]